MKAFTGDKSDNIAGYYRVGPVTAKVLCEATTVRNEFFQSEKSRVKSGDDNITVGNQRPKENLLLIDLSLCPYLLDNMMYVSSKQFRPVRFDPEWRGVSLVGWQRVVVRSDFSTQCCQCD